MSQVIHSFIPDISIAPLQVQCYSEVLQATTSEGLAQGLYVAARHQTYHWATTPIFLHFSSVCSLLVKVLWLCVFLGWRWQCYMVFSSHLMSVYVNIWLHSNLILLCLFQIHVEWWRLHLGRRNVRSAGSQWPQPWDESKKSVWTDGQRSDNGGLWKVCTLIVDCCHCYVQLGLCVYLCVSC